MKILANVHWSVTSRSGVSYVWSVHHVRYRPILRVSDMCWSGPHQLFQKMPQMFQYILKSAPPFFSRSLAFTSPTLRLSVPNINRRWLRSTSQIGNLSLRQLRSVTPTRAFGSRPSVYLNLFIFSFFCGCEEADLHCRSCPHRSWRVEEDRRDRVDREMEREMRSGRKERLSNKRKREREREAGEDGEWMGAGVAFQKKETLGVS